MHSGRAFARILMAFSLFLGGLSQPRQSHAAEMFAKPIPTERLILFGGGDMPAAAIKTFIEWAGGTRAKILVIPWASERSAGDILAGFKEDIAAYKVESVTIAPVVSEMPARQHQFLASLTESTAVFFVGGDQNHVMDYLGNAQNIQLAITHAYRSGLPFAGTSAGTAIMSKTMLTGDGDLTVIDPTKVAVRPGLGFLTNVILDQHFIKRQRLNRLLSVFLGATEVFALGVDEDTAVIIENTCRATVVGPTQAVLLQKTSEIGSFSIDIKPPGSRFDLGC